MKNQQSFTKNLQNPIHLILKCWKKNWSFVKECKEFVPTTYRRYEILLNNFFFTFFDFYRSCHVNVYHTVCILSLLYMPTSNSMHTVQVCIVQLYYCFVKKIIIISCMIFCGTQVPSLYTFRLNVSTALQALCHWRVVLDVCGRLSFYRWGAHGNVLLLYFELSHCSNNTVQICNDTFDLWDQQHQPRHTCQHTAPKNPLLHSNRHPVDMSRPSQFFPLNH